MLYVRVRLEVRLGLRFISTLYTFYFYLLSIVAYILTLNISAASSKAC
jgi:hypothetical protein